MEWVRSIDLPIGDWVEAIVNWILANLQPLLDAISAAIGFVSTSLEDFLLWLHPFVLAAILIAIGLWRVNWKFAVFVAVSLFVIMGMNLWEETVSTMALVVAAAFVALVIGFPIGVAMAKNDTVEAVVRPVLDFMQTMPPFVYLIPAAMFFGLGKVPGTIATVIFAMPPSVRLTNLGIRQVSHENVEAGLAFGCTDRQLLTKVQLPLALPSIMAGVNQTIMLALSMVVIASMIGAGGLGNTVLTGIQRLNIGLGFEGGLGVVIVAILLDRLTQSIGHMGRGESVFRKMVRVFRGQPSGAQAEGEAETKTTRTAS